MVAINIKICLFYTDKRNSCVIFFYIVLICQQMACLPVRYVSMAVPDDGFIKRLKHVARSGQWKFLCGNTAVIDGLSVCLLQKCWSTS